MRYFVAAGRAGYRSARVNLVKELAVNAFGMILRSTTENHAETPPECDAICRHRWADVPHPHCCPDGLYADDPFVTITNWCSCGALINGPLELDFREPTSETRAAEHGDQAFRLFREHMLAVHSIDIEKDETWLNRLAADSGR